MIRSDPSNDEQRNPVDVLADEFAGRIRGGETPSIDEYVRQHPDLEAEIRAIFPAVARIEKASRQQLSHADSPSLKQLADLKLEKIGDFQIIRQLGQGGMGIVYEALQVSLHRHVALKVISPAISNSPKQLARFQREAATAARLHHTNIVPVFGSGEENGIHYYAMQLIDGIPLHTAVRNLRQTRSYDFESTASGSHVAENRSSPAGARSAGPSTNPLQADSQSPPTGTAAQDVTHVCTGSSEDHPGLPAAVSNNSQRKTNYHRKVCGFIADIADALHYAHDQGVLHRDIKPSNLLMDQHGIVWVTDFGLAKYDDQDGITRTGDMVGTLRYMAPEQFNGDCDARSDVYSLGLTLYELLVLQPAYAETRSAPLMKLKSEQPPLSPRKIDESIPRDLDTIVMKACAVDPGLRYQSAAEFRDDLHRFIEGRNISARRASMVEQTWRWARRNPMIASLSCLSATLLIAVAIVSIIANQMTRSALQEKELEYQRAEASRTAAQNALADARKQKQLAEANFSTAIRAFEEIMENISRRGIPQGIAVETEQEEVRSFETSLTNSDVEVLETLLAFFAEFAEKNKADLSLQSAQAQLRVAQIQQNLGRLVEAENTFRRAIRSFATLGPDKLAPQENELIQMRIANELAYCANRRGDFETAESSLDQARRIFESGQNRGPEMKLELARSLNLFTSMYTRVGYVINRRIIISQPHRNAKTANRTDPKSRMRKSPGKRQKVWVTINNLYAEKKTRIRRANENAIRILLELIEKNPENSTYQLELSRAYQDRVRINRQARDQKIAAHAFEQAKKILETLVEKHPNNPAYRFELADLLCNLEKTPKSFSNPAAAARVAKELVEKWPSVSEYQALYANAQARSVIQRLRDNPANRKRLEECVNIYRELVFKYPDYYAYKINFVQYLIILATQYSATQEPKISQQLFDEAETCLKSMETEDENDALIATIQAELLAARKSAANRGARAGRN